jgi:hypothetical protein
VPLTLLVETEYAPAPRRIIELAVRGERDPERLKAVVLAWVTK